jgi:LPS-assembly lipoprotein
MPAFAGMTGFGTPGAWLLAMAALGALQGCGFSPLYGGNPWAPVAGQLDEVAVANIPERTGQLLRESLQAQLQAAGAPDVQRYVLNVNYSIAGQGEGTQADTSVTRERFVATAAWSLSPIGDPGQRLASGQATTEDALNIIDNQYFAQDLETNTVNRQLADQIAQQITTQVAVYFKTHG